MKLKYVVACFFCVCLISGCTKVNIKPLRYNEVLGANGYPFDGRIFSANCSGKTSAEDVCLQRMSEITIQNGFEYFTVLSSNQNETATSASFNTYAPTTSITNYSGMGGYGTGVTFGSAAQMHMVPIVKHTYQYTFILLDQSEINYFDNFYNVYDYLE